MEIRMGMETEMERRAEVRITVKWVPSISLAEINK
jgi:hypothetical protein